MPQVAYVANENTIRSHFDALVRRGAFKPILRFLPVEIGEDRLQDAVCQTFELFRRHALEKRKLLPDPILVLYCRRRARDPGRHFVRCDGTARRKCALDWRNFRDGRVEILRLDGILQGDHDELPREGDRELVGLAVATSACPVSKIHSAIDLVTWLDGLDATDRALLASRATGLTLEETGTELGLSVARVHYRTRQLGEELARRVSSVSASTRRAHRGSGDGS